MGRAIAEIALVNDIQQVRHAASRSATDYVPAVHNKHWNRQDSITNHKILDALQLRFHSEGTVGLAEILPGDAESLREAFLIGQSQEQTILSVNCAECGPVRRLDYASGLQSKEKACMRFVYGISNRRHVQEIHFPGLLLPPFFHVGIHPVAVGTTVGKELRYFNLVRRAGGALCRNQAFVVHTLPEPPVGRFLSVGE